MSVDRTGGLDDRSPARDFARDQGSKDLLSALALVRYVAAKFEQALAHIVVVERLVERVAELVEDRLWRPLGRKQRVPGQSQELRQAGLLRGWDVGQGWVALGGSDRIGLDRPTLNLRNDVRN